METEAKFVVPGEATFARLHAVVQFGPYEKRGEKTQVIHDLYVDTPDHRFHHKQLYVRLRQIAGGDLLVTIKSNTAPAQGAVHAREEHQVKVPSFDMSEWPQSEVRRMIEEIAGDRSLVKLVGVDQTRVVSNLYQGDRAVVELSLDEVTIQTAHEPVTVYELEAELLPQGLISDLRVLVRIFSDEYGLDPQPLSKLERAMSMAGNGSNKQEDNMAVNHQRNGADTPKTTEKDKPATPVDFLPAADETPLLESGLPAAGLPVEGSGDAGTPTRNLNNLAAPVVTTEPEQPAAPDEASPKKGKRPISVDTTDSINTAARKIMRTYFDAMLAKEQETDAEENVKTVHDMRVATRRMRSLMEVLGPYLQSDHTRQIRRGLEVVAGALGVARDLDVLIANAGSFRDSLPDEQTSDLEGIVQLWRKRRSRAQKKLLRLLGSKEYSRFKKSMDKFLTEKEKPRNEGNVVRLYQVRHILPTALITRYEAVRAFETAVEGEEQLKPVEDSGDSVPQPPSHDPQMPHSPSMEQLHALRISGKYLRYTLECFREALPSSAKGLIKDVVGLQDQLGALHDADVAVTEISEYISGMSKRKKKRDPEYSVPPGLAAYKQDREEAIRRIRADFFPTWAKLQTPEWRVRLAALIVA